MAPGEDDGDETVTFQTWDVQEVPDDDEQHGKYDYVVESGAGVGVIYCTERQLRSLVDAATEALEDDAGEGE